MKATINEFDRVILTENIRNYYDVLGRFQPPYTPGYQLPADLSSPSNWRLNLPGAWYSLTPERERAG